MMRTEFESLPARPTIFDSADFDPRRQIAEAVEAIDIASTAFRHSRAEEDQTALLDRIEDLRRFVLVRASLARRLKQPMREGAPPAGREICSMLNEIIGDVPSLVKACEHNGRYRMERDTRRAISSLFFLGTLDPNFI
jgi:hypothetical protein